MTEIDKSDSKKTDYREWDGVEDTAYNRGSKSKNVVYCSPVDEWTTPTAWN